MGNLVTALNQNRTQTSCLGTTLASPLGPASWEYMQIGLCLDSGLCWEWNSSIGPICLSALVVISVVLFTEPSPQHQKEQGSHVAPLTRLWDGAISLCPESFVTISFMERVDIAGPWLTSMNGLFYNIMIPLLLFVW